jgi:type IV pilus assembly protein PilQ
MKARTRGLYLVLIGAAAVAAWQECGALHGLVFTRSVAYAQTVPPTVLPEPAMPAAPEAGSPLIVPPVPSPAPSPAEKLPPSRAEALPPSSAETLPPSLAPESDSLAMVSAAKTLKDIDVQMQDGGVNVVLRGDGQFSYRVFRLRANRLVVDLDDVINGTKSGTKSRTLVVGHPLLKQIRIASYLQPQRKVRLVLDLPRAISYTAEKNGAELQIALSEATPAPQPHKNTEQAAAASLDIERPGPEKTPVEKTSLEKTPLEKTPLEKPLLEKTSVEKTPVRSQAPSAVRVQGPALPRLSPSTTFAEPSEHFTGKRISLDFQDAEISSVLRLIADVSGLNMVVGEGAKAKVSLKLLNVPWDQALELILKLNQLGQIREGNIIWIDSLSNIARQKDEAVRAHEATVKAEPLATRIMYLNYADAPKTLDIVKSNLSTRGEVKVDLRTNALVVKDIGENIHKIERLLRDLDRVTPQVQIEARIVQAAKSFARGIGVQWGISGIQSTSPSGFAGTGALHSQGPVIVNIGRRGAAFSTGDASAASFLVDLAATASGANIPTSAIGLTVGKFLGTSGTLDLRLSAGESLGLTKIVSAPKIITLDNKPAKIEQGSQVPFQTTSLQGTQTTFVDATLTLNVTPHVIPFAQTIRLEIKATKNSIGAAVSAAGPTIDKKEATTEVLLRDGETTVLGGIFEETRTDNTQGIPWFNRIPFLGWLFKNEAVTLAQSELLVFITPIILKD